MERLELALRRYEQLVPKAIHLHADVPLQDLKVWLREDVSPVLEDFTGRPTFRDNASWPVTTFMPESQSMEIGLVEQFNAESQTCAKALVKLANGKLLQRKLQELFPPERRVSGETVSISSSGKNVIERTYAEYPQIEPLHHAVEAICRAEGRTAIVNVNDYFEPQQQWAKLADGTYIQHGEWIVSLSSDLLPVGNFVVRCLLKRIELRIDPITNYRRMCSRALSAIGPKYQAQFTDFQKAWRDMTATSEKIVTQLRTGQANLLRDACVAATQLYAAVHPQPDLSWLGLDQTVVRHGTDMLRARISGLQNAHVFDRIAAALGELKRLYPEDRTGTTATEQAIARGDLVIDEVKGEAYWETNRLKVSPREVQWKLLSALGRRAKHGAAAGMRDVYGEADMSDTAITTNWSRLKGRLPRTLHILIVPGDERRTYRLRLDSRRIHVIPKPSR